MKVTIDREVFQRLLKRVSGAVPTRTPKEILRYILMEVSGDCVTLTAQGPEHGVVSKIHSGFTVGQPGSALLPTGKMLQVVAESGSCETISIESDGSWLTVSYGSTVFRLLTVLDEYPRHEQRGEGRRYEIIVDQIIRAGKRARVATGDSGARFNFHAVQLKTDGKAAQLVGTNGKAVTLSQVQLDSAHDGEGEKILIDPALLALIDSACAGQTDQMATIIVSQSEIAVEVGDTLLFSRLQTGAYPDVTKVLFTPAETVTVLAGDLRRVLSTAGTMMEKEDSTICLTVEADELRASADNDTVGHSQVRHPVAYTGKPIKTFFNPDSTLKWVQTFPPETSMDLQWQGNDRPMCLVAGGARLVISPKVSA